MGDHVHARRGSAVLIKRGEIIPEDAVPLTNEEVVAIQLRRIEVFKPQSEVRAFNYGSYLLCANAAVSSIFINNIMRQNFKLGALRRAFTYVPTVLVSSLVAFGVHEFGVKQKILLGQEHCPTCTTVRSGSLQALSGVAYPFVMSFLTCLPIAREFYTLPMPESKGAQAYFRILRRASPSSSVMLFLGISNMLLGMWIAKREVQVFVKHLSKPPSTPELPIDLGMNN